MGLVIQAWMPLPLIYTTRLGSDQDAALLVLPHHRVQLECTMEPRAGGRGAGTVCRA